MPKQYGDYRISALALVLTFGASGLSAQHLLLSVSAHAGSQCGSAISSMLDQQGTEARLRAVGFQISNARNATLAHEVECSVDQRTVSVQQCLALSEFVAGTSESRAVQLATKWRECKAYKCAGKACSESVSAGLSDLEGLFATSFSNRNDATVGPAPTRIAPAPVSQPANSSAIPAIGGIPGAALYYGCYILICITVIFRWSLANSHAKHAK